MMNSDYRWQSLVLSMLPAVFVFSSTTANAAVYKWIDSRGVTQYSASQVVPSATKATQNEIVNALQSKDVCTGSTPPTNRTQTISTSTKNPTTSAQLARSVTRPKQ
jgi:hypothetical protein